ncbi:MAG TPA: TraB/GumN family protein [Chitinophagaceae bacterium]|nr:TraB/GumN family protein [Chitinophagaceae bacterium]HNU15204.1 TraB/GumN family protein [Chitinophagaceae bacterium]
MLRFSSVFLLSLLAVVGCAQKNNDKKDNQEVVNSLLWKIEGNGLEKPSYLFGTIHMICKEDAVLSENMKKIINDCDEVYFEIDMDNLFEMMGAMSKMKMLGDTTLKDLLSDSDYLKVKNFFKDKNSLLPFSVLETYKPILASSTLTQSEMPCDGATAMEQVIMSAAKESKKKIKGLETMAQQAGFLDSIPYKYQAEELVKYIDSSTVSSGDDKMMNAMFEAYRQQDLKKLEELMVDSDAGLSSFTNILLYNRNANWVEKLKTLMTERSLLVAVGAGHLPGDKGVINLLKKEGYTVTPVKNKLKKVKEI